MQGEGLNPDRGGLGCLGPPRDFPRDACAGPAREREFFVDNLLVRILFIIVMMKWTGLDPWEFEFPFLGSLTSTFRGMRAPHLTEPDTNSPLQGHLAHKEPPYPSTLQ